MIVLADSDPRFQARVSDQIGRREELVIVDGTTQLDKVLHDKAGRISVVILGPNIGLEEAFAVARSMQTTAQDVSVILVASAVTAEALQQALRSGVRDVLPASFTGSQLSEAVGRAEALSAQIRGTFGAGITAAPSQETDHKVITVFSSK